MTSRYLCQQYQSGETVFSTKVDGTSYFAAVECSQLPPERMLEDRIVRRGAAVGLDRWFFFPAPEPAVAFVRAARMSLDRTARHHGAYNAARETRFCHLHDRDEVVLLIDVNGEDLDRAAAEADHLTRFVQGVREQPAVVGVVRTDGLVPRAHRWRAFAATTGIAGTNRAGSRGEQERIVGLGVLAATPAPTATVPAAGSTTS